jgi:hypothetical protein
LIPGAPIQSSFRDDFDCGFHILDTDSWESEYSEIVKTVGRVEKQKIEEKIEEMEEKNAKIRARNELIEKKNARNERINRVFSNTTDNSTGSEVRGVFNNANNQPMVENRRNGIFNQSNRRLQQTDKSSGGKVFNVGRSGFNVTQ